MLSKLLATLLLCTAAYAEPLVDVTLKVVDPTLSVGDVAEVQVWLSASPGVSVKVAGAQVLVEWDADELELQKFDPTGAWPWMIEGFWGDPDEENVNFPCVGPPNPLEVCIPDNDGDLLFVALAAFGNPPTVTVGEDYPRHGVLVTTIQFKVLAVGELRLSIPPFIGTTTTSVPEFKGEPDVSRRLRGARMRAR